MSVLAGAGVRLWDVTDPYHPVEGVTLPKLTVSGGFLLTGRTLVTFDRDHMATRLWEVTDAHHVTQQAVLAEPYDPQQVGDLFSPDSRMLATTAQGLSNTRLLDLDIDRLTRYVCSTGTTITRSQWEQHISELPYESPCG